MTLHAPKGPPAGGYIHPTGPFVKASRNVPAGSRKHARREGGFGRPEPPYAKRHSRRNSLTNNSRKAQGFPGEKGPLHRRFSAERPLSDGNPRRISAPHIQEKPCGSQKRISACAKNAVATRTAVPGRRFDAPSVRQRVREPRSRKATALPGTTLQGECGHRTPWP